MTYAVLHYAIFRCNELLVYFCTKSFVVFLLVVVTSGIRNIIMLAKCVDVIIDWLFIVFLKSHFLNRFGDTLEHRILRDILHGHRSKS